jgi:hypothetical protein
MTGGLDEFARIFGEPQPGTAAPDAAFAGVPGATAARSAVGAGVFSAGLVSFCSVREQGVKLEGWPIPADERPVVFASTGFGTMFAMGKSGMWVVDAVEGTVFDTDLSVEELLDQLASEESRTGSVDQAGFERWVELHGPPGPREILVPRPLPALGGSGNFASLAPADLRVHVDLARQILFEEPPQ